jgi:hypothetical protein
MATASDIADDPIRAEVERWLHTVLDATFAVPAMIVRRTCRCMRRQTRAVNDRVMAPLRLVTSLVDLAGRPAPSASETVPVRRRPSGGVSAAGADTVVAGGDPSIDTAALPIDEYESLAASQVVARLHSLTPGELDAVRRFEADHRGRRTVLGKIDQLLAPA